MSAVGWIWFLPATAIFLPTVFCQLIAQTVLVGANGSFFEPETVSAGMNGIVRFLFVGTIHSVVQSSLDSPCSQLAGGFSSGPSGMTNTSVSPPLWDLQITNVTAPIWYYCANQIPSFHCTAGMVGSINPPSIPAFNAFKDSAKLVNTSTLPAATATKALSGQGAMATAFPAAPSSATPSPTPSPSSSVTSTTQSSTPTPVHASTVHKGAIIGGSVGGAMALIVAAALLAWLWVTRLRRNDQQPAPGEYSEYKARPRHQANFTNANVGHTPADPSHPTDLAQASQSNLTDTISNPSTRAQRLENANRQFRVTNDTTPSSPTRTLGPPVTSPLITEQKSYLSMQPSASSMSTQDGPPNISMLAREVAAHMMQNTLGAPASTSTRPSPPNPQDSSATAPPSYVVHH